MLAHLGTLGDVAQPGEVHVRARCDGRRRTVAEIARARRSLEPRERERPRRLPHRACVLERIFDGGADLVDADGETAIEVALAERERELAGLPRRHAVGEETDVLATHTTALAQRLGHRARV